MHYIASFPLCLMILLTVCEHYIPTFQGPQDVPKRFGELAYKVPRQGHQTRHTSEQTEFCLYWLVLSYSRLTCEVERTLQTSDAEASNISNLLRRP
jgi:hypothetical protein